MWTMLQDNGYINKAQGLYKIPWSRDFWPKVEDYSLDAANEQSASRKGYSRCYQNRRHRAGRQDNGSGDRFSFRSFFGAAAAPDLFTTTRLLGARHPKNPRKTQENEENLKLETPSRSPWSGQSVVPVAICRRHPCRRWYMHIPSLLVPGSGVDWAICVPLYSGIYIHK